MFISVNFFYQNKQRLIKSNYWLLSRIQICYSFGNNIKGVFDQYWWLWIIVPQSKHIGEGWILSLTYTLMLPMIHYLAQLLQPFLHVQAILLLSYLLQICSFQKTLLTFGNFLNILMLASPFMLATFAGKYAGLTLVYLYGSFLSTTSLEKVFGISQALSHVSCMWWLIDVAVLPKW